MQDELVSYEVAVLAKEKGFNEPCINGFSIQGGHACSYGKLKKNFECVDSVTRPTQTSLERWLRERYDIHLIINWYIGSFKWQIKLLDTDFDDINGIRGYSASDFSESAEIAKDKGLLYSLKLINNAYDSRKARKK